MGTPWEIADQASRMLREAQSARDDVRALLTETRRQREAMAATALWCSLGEHAFGPQDRKRTTFHIETINEETDQLETITATACGPCSATRKELLKPQRAIPAGVDKDQYMAFLEWHAGIRPEPPAAPGE